ncbi:hypothetical protein HOP50_01g03000 [Chloropicon primus]|nr:hypothetical protein HOP50_01g03000 [Chloropicon primus]
MLGGKHYEHVLSKTRGMFSYQSNSLEMEKDKITAHRAQRRVSCGWASSVHKPYRPLGTPDVLDKRKVNLLKQSYARYGQGLGNDAKGKKSSKMVLNTLSGASDNAYGDLDEEEEDNSCFDLKTEIKNSNIRRIGCRSGASFKDVLFKQSPTKSPKSGEPLPKIVSRLSQSGNLNSPQASPSTKMRLPVVPSPTASPEKREAQRQQESTSKLVSPKLPNVPGELKVSSLSMEPLTLDPSTSMSNRLDEFRQVKTKMNDNLATKLKSLSEERFETYKRKLQSFNTDYHTFSTERWKLEAERVKIEARLNALNMHKWYFSFIQFFDSMTRHTPAEKVIISQVKYVIEGGYEYDHKDFQRLIALLPKRAFKMTSVLQILNNLRNELEIGSKEYLQALESCDITVPSWSISKGRRTR